VLALVIIINILDIYSVGTSVLLLSFNVIVSIIFVWIANKTCFSYRWVSWIIVAYLALTVMFIISGFIWPEGWGGVVELGMSRDSVAEQQARVKDVRDQEKKLFTA
jgi:hypothetical protein